MVRDFPRYRRWHATMESAETTAKLVRRRFKKSRCLAPATSPSPTMVTSNCRYRWHSSFDNLQIDAKMTSMATDVLGNLVIDEFRGPYQFLSNFYECCITLYESPFMPDYAFPPEGITFGSSEQVYMWHKSLIEAERDAILACKTPAAAKKQGGPEFTTLRPGWREDLLCIDVMLFALDAKFIQHPDLQSLLMQTGDSPLIEGNWWHDNFWGNCLCPRPACKSTVGLNHLGKLHEFRRAQHYMAG